MAEGGPGRATRIRNRWGEGERLRLEILEAASRLLSELDGDDGLSLRAVARATGIAPASVYQHFSDRDALMDGLLAHECRRLAAVLEDARLAAPPDDPLGQLRAQLHAYCEFATANPGHHRVLFRRGPGSTEGRHGPLRDITSAFAAACERCARAGYTLRLPGGRAGVVVFVAAHGRVALFHSNPTERNASLLRPFVEELISLVVE
jgi:AcrR family transcriptional regulator